MTMPAYAQALPRVAAAVKAAEAFAAHTTPVAATTAYRFRDSVRSARHILDYHQGQLRSVPPVRSAVQVVPSDTPSTPTPPANAIFLARAAAGDVRHYERAKARALAEGKTLWFE
jgi:hypothetical protein